MANDNINVRIKRVDKSIDYGIKIGDIFTVKEMEHSFFTDKNKKIYIVIKGYYEGYMFEDDQCEII